MILMNPTSFNYLHKNVPEPFKDEWSGDEEGRGNKDVQNQIKLIIS
jgi:hypothetical protein